MGGSTSSDIGTECNDSVSSSTSTVSTAISPNLRQTYLQHPDFEVSYAHVQPEDYPMSNLAAVVFTSKSIEQICHAGGTQSWRMHHSHIGTFDYVICTKNRRRHDVQGSEEHGSAFLIGKVQDTVLSTDTRDPNKPRFLIRMAEAAIIKGKPHFWQWGRWPVHFEDLTSLGIDPTDYDFKPLRNLLKEVQLSSGGLVPPSPRSAAQPTGPSSWKEAIDRAKLALAADLAVDAEAIEISVRM
jgi:hypothetical protein